MANRRASTIPVTGQNPQVAIGGAIGGIARDDGSEATAAFNTFHRLASELGAIADDQAKGEGARQGAIDGAQAGFKPTLDATIRGRAYDSAGEAAYLATTNASFQSDAMDLYRDHHNDPAGFTEKFKALTQNYAQRVGTTGAHLVGDFNARAATLGTSLRMKVLDGFDEKQKDQARARLYESTNAHATAIQKLAITDPEGPATMQAAQSNLKSLDAQIDGLVADGQMTAVEAAKQKREARASTLLTLYSGRAEKMTNPEDVETLRKQVRADFTAGKMAMLDGDTFEKLDSGLAQLAVKRKSQFAADTAAFEKKLDDYVERNAKALTPPAGEYEALQAEAKKLGGKGDAMLALAKGKLQVETTMRRLDPVARAAYLSQLEGEAKSAALPDASLRMTRDNWSLNFYKPSDFMAPSAGGQFVNARAATMADALGRKFFEETGIRVGVNDPHNFDAAAGTGGKRRGTSDPNDNPHVENSRHVHGDAFDFQTQGLTDAQKARFLTIAREVGFTGVGFYKSGNGHMHLDTGADRSWDDGTGRPAWAEAAMQTRAKPGGVTKPMSELVLYARGRNEALNRLENEDPLRAAEQASTIPGGQIMPVDFNAPADTMAKQMQARVIQAGSIAQASNRPPKFFRPEEKTVLGETLKQGGEKALAIMDGIVRGAGTKAPQALAEIGDGAPELAHATIIAVQTGDATLQKRAAEALAARNVAGAKPIRPSGDELDAAMKAEAGGALRGVDLAQRERIKQTVALVYEREAAQRGLDKTDDKLLAELVQAAAGRTRIGDKSYGGFADHKPSGWWTSSIKVMVPPDVRPEKFSAVLGAISDDDIKNLPDPPVDPRGKVMTASDLLTFAPHAGRGGYRFGNVDAQSNEIAPVKTKSGAIFFLPWDRISGVLKARVPDAFRS